MSGAGGAQENDRNEGGIVIAGGELRHVVMGHQSIESQTVVSHTYNPVGASGIAVEPGTFGIHSHILVHELNPISASSRVFNADLRSGVTGTKPIVVKLTPHGPRFLREAKIHFSVPHHKNIVERIATDVFNFRGVPTIFIAMERCDCNLHDHVKSEVRDDVAFNSEKYTWISYQILVALNFLHSQNVIHGDLKPSNVLILNGNIVKLCDFGLSRAITEGHSSTQLSSPQGGTSGWLAPEILEGATQISKPSDIFPCGLIFHFTWSYGKHAYGDNPVSRNHFIMVGENRDLSRMLIDFVDEATTLLERMFQRNPADRPTAAEILQNPIFGHFDTEPLSVGQFQTALRSYLQRNRLQLTRIPSDSQSDEDEQEGEILAQPSESMRLGSEVGSEGESSSEEDLQTTAPKQHFQYFTPSHLVQSTSNQHSLMPVSTAQGGDHSQLPEGFASAPVCRRGCDILLISEIEGDEELLPQLALQIFGSVPRDGKQEFMHRTSLIDGPDLFERLQNMPVCASGITTVIVARGMSVLGLNKAFNEIRIWNGGAIKSCLAVFTFEPYTNISRDMAEVTLNIELSTNASNCGILKTGTLRSRKRVNRITFHGEGSGVDVSNSTCLLLEDFIEKPEIVGIMQKFLRREEGSVEYCVGH